MAGLFIIFNSMLSMEKFIKDNHYYLFYLALAVYPKFLFILDENLENLKIDVWVGQKVDTVGQVGKQRQITGFQTHQSPVVIDKGERAELSTDQYLPIGNTILENLVIVKKNPEFTEEQR